MRLRPLPGRTVVPLALVAVTGAAVAVAVASVGSSAQAVSSERTVTRAPRRRAVDGLRQRQPVAGRTSST